MASRIRRSPPLRVHVRRVLLERLLSGQLSPGDIHQERLAENLGVSRTPLREALLRLEVEGFVRSTAGGGFTVAPLDRETAVQLYEVVGELEALAVSLTSRFTDAQLGRLEELNEQRSRRRDPEGLVELDTRWHRGLVSRCRNPQLLELLELARNRLYRFEYAYLRGYGRKEDAIRQHAEIIERLRAGDAGRAGEILRTHWGWGVEALAEDDEASKLGDGDS